MSETDLIIVLAWRGAFPDLAAPAQQRTRRRAGCMCIDACCCRSGRPRNALPLHPLGCEALRIASSTHIRRLAGASLQARMGPVSQRPVSEEHAEDRRQKRPDVEGAEHVHVRENVHKKLGPPESLDKKCAYRYSTRSE